MALPVRGSRSFWRTLVGFIGRSQYSTLILWKIWRYYFFDQRGSCVRWKLLVRDVNKCFPSHKRHVHVRGQSVCDVSVLVISKYVAEFTMRWSHLTWCQWHTVCWSSPNVLLSSQCSSDLTWSRWPHNETIISQGIDDLALSHVSAIL